MKRAVIWTAVSGKAQAQDDKISLPLQERNARAWCEKNGYTVIANLIVPGHSRSESDIITLFEDYAEIGIFAYHDLRKMWQAKAFDVLVAYSKDRLARSATGITWVIENTIKSGALLYTTDDAGGGGWITPDNYRFSAAIGGMTVTSGIEQFQHKTAEARSARVARGIPLSVLNVPYTHRLVNDERGKPVRLELDVEKQRFLHDLKELILQGVGWEDIEDALWQRGHGRDGKPFSRHFVYHLIHNPFFWGHSALRYQTPNPGGQATNHWLYDDSVPVPSEVEIHWNIGVAAWQGADASAVIAELKRRRIVTKGRGGSSKNYAFTGLVVCGCCGYNMVYQYDTDGNQNPYYRCRPNKRQPTRCKRNRNIAEHKIVRFISPIIEALIQFGNIPLDDAGGDVSQPHSDHLKAEISDVEQRIMRLIRKQSEPGLTPQIATMYDEQIRDFGVQLQALQTELQRLEAAGEQTRLEQSIRREAIEDMRGLRLEQFWQLPSTQINQYMHRLFGNVRVELSPTRQLRLVKKSKK
jgi:hypothetical protein